MLKIGDKVCLIKGHRWGTGNSYYFSEVVRLTKTMAVLANGRKLVNNGIKYPHREVPDALYYKEHGDKWTEWQLTTPEIIKECEIQREEDKAVNWFHNYKFNVQDKIKIYNLFNKQQ